MNVNINLFTFTALNIKYICLLKITMYILDFSNSLYCYDTGKTKQIFSTKSKYLNPLNLGIENEMNTLITIMNTI